MERLVGPKLGNRAFFVQVKQGIVEHTAEIIISIYVFTALIINHTKTCNVDCLFMKRTFDYFVQHTQSKFFKGGIRK